MGKINLGKLTPMMDKVVVSLSKAGKTIADVVRDRNFHIGVLTAFPATVGAFFKIKKLEKQAAEKEASYKMAIAKHNALIKELSTKAEIDKERQDRLLEYDSKLKEETSGLQSEIQELNKQIAEFKKEGQR